MTDTPVTTADPLERPLTRREVIKRGAVGGTRDRGGVTPWVSKRSLTTS